MNTSVTAKGFTRYRTNNTMPGKMRIQQTIIALFVTSLFLLLPQHKGVLASSTFKLQKGNTLIYGHNLNEGDIGVPGLVFINKRGMFKTGRTWSEIITRGRVNPSSHTWISRYGSVTFNNFGKDFPDGGMNEAGLFIWEANEEADYPKNDSLPKLNQMNWMQYILDNYSTTEEAIRSASEFEIDGWSWHFFVGDAGGNTAAIAFLNGGVVVHSGDEMPVPALFNAPYDRELELLKYFRGFGGEYQPDETDPNVPRFVRTAVMIDNYQKEDDPIDYGFYMLKTLRVFDDPEWSILFDAENRMVYFRTRMNPERKTLVMDEIDFSNNEPAQVMNIATAFSGNILSMFVPYSKSIMQDFIRFELLPILPTDFITHGDLSPKAFTERIVNHTDSYTDSTNHFFKGTWESIRTGEENELHFLIEFEVEGNAVKAVISQDGSDEHYKVDNLRMFGNQFCFTFQTKSGKILEVKGTIRDDEMRVNLLGIEKSFGDYSLKRTD
jgi:choloylglycine hydrolase